MAKIKRRPVINYLRQTGLVSPRKLAQVKLTVIGAGGINSPAVLVISKMGVRQIEVYDHDIISSHNIPNQFYPFRDIGKLKVTSLEKSVFDYAGVSIIARREKYEHQALSGLVVSGVDSMDTRKAIWEEIKKQASVPLYIDARMGALIGRIFSIKPTDPDQIGWYEETLYSHEEAVQLPCTARAISFNTFVLAGLIADQIKKWVNGEEVKKNITVDLGNLRLVAY